MLNAGLIEERCQREASEIRAAAAGSKTRSAKRDRTNMATFRANSVPIALRHARDRFDDTSRSYRLIVISRGNEQGARSSERGNENRCRIYRFDICFPEN